MADDLQDSAWHVVNRSRAATEAENREQIEQWNASKKYWTGTGQKHIKYTELPRKVHFEKQIGAGTAGSVDRVTYGTVTMARKKIDRRSHRYATLERLRTEAEIMDKLVHRHIVSLVGTYTKGNHELYILTFPAAVCDLDRFLNDIEDLHLGTIDDDEEAVKRLERLGFRAGGDQDALEHHVHAYLMSVLGCITEALTYIHAQRIRHQDLKPKNILLSPGQVYLADFGISRDLKDSPHSVTDSYVGLTHGYAAPEVEAKGKYHPASADVYSLGAVFLNVATVVYGETRRRCGEVMSGFGGPANRREMIDGYLAELRPLATKTGRAAEDALTCLPRHLLGLTEAMLSHEPGERPSAEEVGRRLVEIGGIEQIYHGGCCKKSAAHVSKLIEAKLQATTARLAILEAERAADKALIATLTATNETYETRLNKERNHLAELQNKQLAHHQAALDAALARNKALEAELAALRGGGRRGRGGRRSRTPMLTQMATTIGTMRVPPTNAVMATVQPAPKPSMPPPEAARPSPVPIRRQSGIPLPLRPSTPIRVQTPTTPVRPVGRNLSAESTLLNSVHSTFSVVSMASSASSLEGSPVVEKKENGMGGGGRASVPVAHGEVGMDGGERGKVVLDDVGRERGKRERGESERTIMTWAQRARGRVRA